MPLTGRVALVTGVSRREGIGLAVARRLHDLGAVVHASGWSPHDDEMPWGRGPALNEPFPVDEHDLSQVDVPALLVDEVVERQGAIDIVVAVHARSASQPLLSVTGKELDRCWATNVRSVVLLARRFAERRDPSRPGGRMVWFTSGQHLGPMADELPYAISKGALHQMTASLAAGLGEQGIVANCINPGPVDTGWASEPVRRETATRFPAGRWTDPSEIAALVAFLVSDEGAVVNGQVVDAESGFRRS